MHCYVMLGTKGGGNPLYWGVRNAWGLWQFPKKKLDIPIHGFMHEFFSHGTLLIRSRKLQFYSNLGLTDWGFMNYLACI